MNKAEELMNKVLTAGRADEFLEIIRDPGVTAGVLSFIITKNRFLTPTILSEMLDSPVLNEEVYNLVFEINKNNPPSDVDEKIVNSPFFNKEMYEYYVNRMNRRNIYNPVIKSLINSPYATKDAYLEIIHSNLTLSSDICIDIMNSPLCNSDILAGVVGAAEDNDTLSAALDSPYLNADIFDTILHDYNMLADTYSKAMKSKFVTKKILLDQLGENDNLFSICLDQIVKLPICDEEVLRKTLCCVTNANAIKAISTSPNATPAIFKQIISMLQAYNFTAEHSFDILKSVTANPNFDEDTAIEVFKWIDEDSFISTPEVREICKQVAELPWCNEDVAAKAVLTACADSILENVKDEIKNSKKVKVASIIVDDTNNDEKFDKLLSVEGVDNNDIAEYIKIIHTTEETLRRVMALPNIDVNLYKTIIEAVREYMPNDAILYELLERDIPEIVLIEMLINSKDPSIALKVLKHKNAGIKTADAAILASANYDSKFWERDICNEAQKLRKNIIAKTFRVEEEENVTEILRRNVEDGLTTMLWGPSGVGKSSRVFEIDPTATMLILKNGMLPEEVIGGKEPNGKPGQIYPPHWYEVLCEKCDADKSRQHILFIDEFTNVSDTIKNLVWEVIGQGLVNGHDEWRLPKNCTIVVAGNRPEESTAVRLDSNGGVMPAPLHNRIASMLEIKFDIDEWQKWALETNGETGKLRIHPVVYSFCAAAGEKVMFSEYDPNDVTQPFLSPRTWEKLSDAIYKAEERGGEFNHISYQRIYSIIGNNDIANAFISHYERIPIDMMKIENGEYKPVDFPDVEDKLYALGIIIAKYEGNDVAIEDFIIECLGDEYLSIYKAMKNNRTAVLDGGLDVAITR